MELSDDEQQQHEDTADLVDIQHVLLDSTPGNVLNTCAACSIQLTCTSKLTKIELGWVERSLNSTPSSVLNMCTRKLVCIELPKHIWAV